MPDVFLNCSPSFSPRQSLIDPKARLASQQVPKGILLSLLRGAGSTETSKPDFHKDNRDQTQLHAGTASTLLTGAFPQAL